MHRCSHHHKLRKEKGLRGGYNQEEWRGLDSVDLKLKKEDERQDMGSKKKHKRHGDKKKRKGFV